MPSRLTHEQVVKRLKSISPKIVLLDQYYNNATPLQCRCGTCQHKWKTTWANLAKGTGCPKCCLTRLSVEAIQKRAGSSIQVLDRVSTSGKAEVLCLCTKCRHKWSTRVDNFAKQSGCPKCKIENQKVGLDYIRRQLKRTNVVVLSKTYKDNRTLMRCQCSECGTKWRDTWQNLEAGSNCPMCHPHIVGASEAEVRRTLERLTGWKFPGPVWPKWLKGRGKRPLSLDGYNERHQVAFEYQGEQHYMVVPHWHRNGERDLHRQKLLDKRKRMACFRQGVTLICVPYWIKRGKPLREFLRKKLGL